MESRFREIIFYKYFANFLTKSFWSTISVRNAKWETILLTKWSGSNRQEIPDSDQTLE